MGIVGEMVEDAMDDVGEMDDIDDPVRKLVFYTKILGCRWSTR